VDSGKVDRIVKVVSAINHIYQEETKIVTKLTYRDREKIRYRELRPKLFSNKAQPSGTYRGSQRDFCLADGHSDENLHESIRKGAIQYFRDRKITWHDGLDNRRLPSNHLCCSQSCCINFLYPMVTNKELVSDVFGKIYSDLAEPIVFTKDQPLPNGLFPFMAFEWIGVDDYLGETRRKVGERTRGANYTSADFAFRFKRKDGRIQIVLGEWKYTEEYRTLDKGIEVRKQNYLKAFNRSGGVFRRRNDSLYSTLFFEPFYQLMRLQLLAQEMEYHKEMEADIVTLLHICPKENTEFRNRVTSPELAKMFPGIGTLDIWKELVPSHKFKSVSTEDLLDIISQNVEAKDKEWAEYLERRYRSQGIS
jgi:hypothetical protein